LLSLLSPSGFCDAPVFVADIHSSGIIPNTGAGHIAYPLGLLEAAHVSEHLADTEAVTLRDALQIAIPAVLLIIVVAAPGEPRWLRRALAHQPPAPPRAA
jgi:hypothetical protein